MREELAEVLVLGAGPAGLAAAAAASEQGADVLLVDENPFAGGQIWRPARGAGPRAETASLLERAARARRLLGAVVFDADAPAPSALSSGESAGAPSPRRLRALVSSNDASGNDVVELVASRVVLALGATERFLPFPGWTLPGVLGVGGLQAMVKGGMEVREQRVAIAGSGPLLLAVAVSLLDAGARVVGVFEQAPRAAVLRFGAGLVRHPRKLVQAIGLLARLLRVRRVHSSWPVRAEGNGVLERVIVRRAAKRAVREETIEIDLLACAFGLAPATGLASMVGCEVRGGRVVVDELQRTTVPNVLCAGEATGIGGVDLALAEGEVAGCAAAGRLDDARAASRRVRSERRFADTLARAFALRAELRELPRDDTVVCRCEDTPWGAIRARRDARQAKLETRCGMGPCQGRVCGPALEVLCGWEREHPRPPLIPVPFDALAVCPSHPEPVVARRDPMSLRRHTTLPGDQR